MITPENQASRLFEHAHAEELFAYLYSYVLFSEEIDISRFNQKEFGNVSAHVQVELDVWIASADPKQIRPDHPSSKYRFSRIYDGISWYFQPAGSKIYNIRFDSDRRGSQSIYAQIDENYSGNAGTPRVLQVSLGSVESDFLVSQQLKNGHIRILSVKGTGVLALLLPKLKSGEHLVMPLAGISIGAKSFLTEEDEHAAIPLSKFFTKFKRNLPGPGFAD